MSTPDEAGSSLHGLGAGLSLPAQGNPVAKAPPALPNGAPPDSPPPAPAVVATPAASMSAEMSMPEPRDLTPEDLMALYPSRHAEREAPPAGAAVLSLGLVKDSLPTPAFTPEPSLPADTALSGMLVPDSQLTNLWLQIESVEADVTSARGMSQNLARELLDRLMQARNLLMNKRSQFEEAARQVAEVKYRVVNFRSATFFQKPAFLSLYLVACFALALAGVSYGQSLTWDRIQIFNTKLDMLWYTMLVGGIGGVTGAAYNLVSHGARDRDFDPQYALWYYQGPWMGLILGIFVYIAVYILMNLGTLVVNQQLASGSLISVLITFFFAWLVGFKHNIAFDLADMVMSKLLPGDNDSDGVSSSGTKP